MNANHLYRLNRLYRCFLGAVVGLTIAACGPDAELASGTQAAAISPRQGAGGEAFYTCHIPVPPGPVDLGAAIIELEKDRFYKSDRPGFSREWIPVGFHQDGTLFVDIVTQLDSTAQAQAFGSWLDNDFILDGTKFWDRPGMAGGHECFVWEVLGSVDRPSNTAQQVMHRTERFEIKGADARQRLVAMWDSIKVEALRRGHSSIFLLYSEAQQVAELMYFEDRPLQERSLFNPITIANRPSYMDRPLVDWSAWVASIWFPFRPADSGHAAVWPMPGIEPWNGDGICSVSRHESAQTSGDCLATCGNGASDPGENTTNCPGDVRL